jgi:cytochrome c oxidase assembly factor CtaG
VIGGAVLAALLLAPYVAATRRCRRWPAARTAAYVAGALVVSAAVSGPFDTAADARLSAHMLQHLVLASVAPALIALGAPVRAALGGLPRPAGRSLARALASRPGHLLARAPVAFGLAAAALLVLHLTPLFDVALAHPLAHAGEHAILFWTALLSWVVVLGVDPLPARPSGVAALACLSASMVAMAVVGAVYVSSDGLLFAHYAGPGALADQRLGGTIMWLGGVAILVPAAVGVAARALRREEARQVRRETLTGTRP